jgi:hypothetical protein
MNMQETREMREYLDKLYEQALALENQPKRTGYNVVEIVEDERGDFDSCIIEL